MLAALLATGITHAQTDLELLTPEEQANYKAFMAAADQHKKTFVAQLHKLGQELLRRWSEGDPIVLINVEARPMPIRPRSNHANPKPGRPN